MNSLGPFTLGDLMGDLRKGKPVSDKLRELAKRYKDSDPEALGIVKRVGEDFIRAIPDDPFSPKIDQVDDDFKAIKKAFKEIDAGDIADEIDKEIQKGLRKKAAKYTVKEILRTGDLDGEAIDHLKGIASGGSGEEREIAEEALKELKAHGISVSP